MLLDSSLRLWLPARRIKGRSCGAPPWRQKLQLIHGRVDKIGYVTDLEGDRRLWWKYAKISKVLEVRPVTTSDDKNGDGRQTVCLKPNCHLVFGGDVNDQYDGDIEVIEELLKLKRKYPDRVHFILGNRDLNKLRLIQELSAEHVKKYPWDETYPGTFWTKIFFPALSPFEQVRSKGVDFVPSNNQLVDRLRWILSCTMGSPNAFMNRYNELLRMKGGHGLSHDVVTANFIDNLKPNGIFSEYMQHAKLALIINDTLFVHGAVCTNSYGWVPETLDGAINDANHSTDERNNAERIRNTDPFNWVNQLNSFAKKGIYDCIHNGAGNDGEPWSFTGSYEAGNPCNNVMQYGMGWLPNGKRNRTIVYNQWIIEKDGSSRAANEINYPSKDIVDNLKKHKVSRILCGHKPQGDAPLVFGNDAQNFHVITADTSYSGRTEYRNGLNEATTEAFAAFREYDELYAARALNSEKPNDISDLRHHCRRGFAVSEVLIDFSRQQHDHRNGNDENRGSVYIHGTLATGEAFEADMDAEPWIGQQTKDGKFIKGIRSNDGKFILSHSEGWKVYNEFHTRADVEKML